MWIEIAEDVYWKEGTGTTLRKLQVFKTDEQGEPIPTDFHWEVRVYSSGQPVFQKTFPNEEKSVEFLMKTFDLAGGEVSFVEREPEVEKERIRMRTAVKSH